MKKIKILLLFLIAILPSVTVTADVKDDEKEVIAQILYNNIPESGRGVLATNYSVVYDKLINGKLTKENFQHQSYSIVRVKYAETSTDFSVEVSKGIELKPGKKLKSEEATVVISSLYKNSKDFLNYLNNDDNGKEEKPVKMTTPGSNRSFMTNEDGKIVAKLKKGYTIFETDYKRRMVTGTFINDDTDIVEVGSSKIVDGLKIDISNIKAKNDSNALSADYGQQVIYELNIDRKKLSGNGVVTLHASPNFVVENINVPHEDELIDNFKKIEVGPQQGNYINYQFSNFEDAEKSVNRKIANALFIKSYSVNLKDISTNKIIVTGHVSSQADYNIDFKFNDGSGYKEFPNYKFTSKNNSEIQGVYVDYTDENGQIIQAVSPLIRTYGINFVTFDGHENNLLHGASYTIGKYSENGDVYLLSKDKDVFSWKKEDFNIYEQDLASKVRENSNFVFDGGKVINIDGTEDEIELSKTQFSYNKKENEQANKSLIQLRGLSDNGDYFICQVNQKSGIQDNNKIYKFSVSTDSISKAQFENYLVNGYIPDYSTNNNEYNAIELLKNGEKTDTPINPYLRIGIIFVSILLIVMLSGILILKKY
ncbi:hypothetical protein BG261_07510 [Floricoccus tropicus]|uniref:Uncharacterized protein n=1 Tax=Floricoccus tropicus TaxID=1859473 RepID=A0A1E8GKF7_9LACT|nr:hypothetical protein [Floricoccus tropicus]OFI48730.1 hypothetical protein BG261_07510 [Floricoccus tropicus]